MNLLFELDGIRGIDFGIRDCRKGVTRKAIALQEKIDAILVVDSQINNADNPGIKNQVLEVGVPTVEFVKMECAVDNGSAAEMVNCKYENSGDYGEMLDDWRGGGEGNKGMEVEGRVEVIDVGVACEVKVMEECGVEKEIPKNLYLEDKSVKERLVESNEKCKIDEWVETEGEEKAKKNDNKRNGELLERMMEENEETMRLITQCFERNEMQRQMLNTLTNRVELLEKSYVCVISLRIGGRRIRRIRYILRNIAA